VRRLFLVLAGAACIAAANPRHAPKAVASDGEATVYVIGDFSRGFNVAYNAVLPAEATNRGMTFAGIMLLGRPPGGSIAFGLTRGVQNQSLQVFVSTTTSRGARHYATSPAGCLPACTLVLRGDRYGIYAFAVTADAVRKLGAWARADYALVRPYVQLNGEVAARGDHIAATLIPMRVVADSYDLPPPRCAFTTRGIAPRRTAGGTLEFTGTYRSDAATSFIDLRTGEMVGRCPR
jgi:hypothetical protein